MHIKGFIDLSMVDWDDKVSAVIFLPRCNFRCPFCYNVALVVTPDELPTIPFEKIESYLERHKEGIEGVVITGGEPTVHKDLPYLCKRLKNMGFMVKLDTNGTGPSMIKELIGDSLVDYIAMDVKAPLTREEYSRATGVDAKGFIEAVKESIKSEVKTIDPSFENLKPFSKEEMENLLMAARTYVKQAKIRG
jgi:pyruvate formate lyase activating enzyme